MGGHPLVTPWGHSYIARPTCRRRAPNRSGTRKRSPHERLALESFVLATTPPPPASSVLSGCGHGGRTLVWARATPRKETPCMTTLFLLAVLGAGDVTATPESAWLSDYGEGLK